MRKLHAISQHLCGVLLCTMMAIAATGCGDDNDDWYPQVDLATHYLEMEYKAYEVAIAIKGDASGLTVYTDEDWLQRSYKSGSTLIVRTTTNNTTSSRYGKVRLLNRRGENLDDVSVEQACRPGSNSGNGGGSNNGSGSNTGTKLKAPTGVTAVNIGTKDNPIVQVTWNSVPNAVTYSLFKSYALPGGAVYTYYYSDIMNEHWVDKTATSNMTYYYEVAACAPEFHTSDHSAIAVINL